MSKDDVIAFGCVVVGALLLLSVIYTGTAQASTSNARYRYTVYVINDNAGHMDIATADVYVITRGADKRAEYYYQRITSMLLRMGVYKPNK